MNNLLFIDVETTGFKRSGLIVEGQARVIQGALIMTDTMGKELASFSGLIYPDGPDNFDIQEGAFEAHGITNDECITSGLPQAYFVEMFIALSRMSNLVIAHNCKSDKAMMEVELAYYGDVRSHAKQSPTTPWYCTMENSRSLCNIPPTDKMVARGRTHPKNPKLGEAYEFFTKNSLSNAHDAMADTRACKEIYFGIQRAKS